MFSLFFNSFGFIGLLGTLLWIWMLYECLKSGKGRQQWIYILIFLNVIGGMLYFIMEWLPNHPNFLAQFGIFNRRKMRDRLWQAEADAKNIGNATQYITLGNLLFDMKKTERAAEAYRQALEKESKNAKALWGAAQAASNQNDYEAAKGYLDSLLTVDPEFSYGEASLAYGEMLYRTKDFDAAKTHLAKHLKHWSNPEGYLILASIQEDQKDIEAARETLETMILKIKEYVPFQYRKNEHFVRRGQQKIRALPKVKS